MEGIVGVNLGVLDNTNLGSLWKRKRISQTSLLDTNIGDSTYPQNAAVKAEALALNVHNITVLVVGGGSHESSLVQVGIELLGLAIDELGGIEALKAVLLEGVEENALGHVETLDKLVQSLVFLSLGSGELLLRHGQQCTIKVVNAVKEILGETLDSELAGSVHITLVALDLVAGVGDCAKVLVL
jgi:hypothetical protein